MKINKEKLAALAALPDDALWAEIVKMTSAYGLDLPKKTPSHTELEKLRETINGKSLNLFEASKILKNYRKG